MELGTLLGIISISIAVIFGAPGFVLSIIGLNKSKNYHERSSKTDIQILNSVSKISDLMIKSFEEIKGPLLQNVRPEQIEKVEKTFEVLSTGLKGIITGTSDLTGRLKLRGPGEPGPSAGE